MTVPRGVGHNLTQKRSGIPSGPIFSVVPPHHSLGHSSASSVQFCTLLLPTLSYQIPSPAPSSRPTLTQPHFARVGQVVVAGHIAPLSLVMPHHDHAVLSGQEVAVRLPRAPVLIELGGGDGGGSEVLQHRSLQGMDLGGLWEGRIMGTGREGRGAQGRGGREKKRAQEKEGARKRGRGRVGSLGLEAEVLGRET